MRRFLRDTTVFGTGLLVCFAVIFAFNSVTVAMNSPRVQASILVTGDSHIQQALDPGIFASAQNISQTAEPYYVTYWKLKHLLVDSTVDTVLLGFAHHNLSAFNDSKLVDEKWSGEMFQRIYPIEKLDSLVGVEVDRLSFGRTKFREMCVIPKLAHHGYIGSFRRLEGSDLTDPTSTTERHFFNSGVNVGVSQVATAHLDSILTLAERRGVPLILVTSPVHRSYFEQIPQNFLEAYETKKREIEGRGVRVPDYGQLDLPDADFYNPDHLNSQGARKFTELVKRTMAQPR